MAEPPRRKSVFAEVGLVDEETIRRERSPTPSSITDPAAQRLRIPKSVRFECAHNALGDKQMGRSNDNEWESDSDGDETELVALGGTKLQHTMFANSSVYRLGLFALALVLMLPILQTNPLFSFGVKAAAIPAESLEAAMVKREDTQTQVCKRWAHQCRSRTIAVLCTC